MKARVQFKLNIGLGLLESLKIEAKKNDRSANDEAVKRLIASFVGRPRVRVKMGRAVV